MKPSLEGSTKLELGSENKKEQETMQLARYLYSYILAPSSISVENPVAQRPYLHSRSKLRENQEGGGEDGKNNRADNKSAHRKQSSNF